MQPWPTRWPQHIQHAAPDLIVVFMGPANTVDAKLPGDDTWRGLGDPKVDWLLWGQMLTAADLLQPAGVPILWFDSPPLGLAAANEGSQADPARMARYNELVDRLTAARPFVARVNWAARVQLLNAAAQVRLRPDGAHPEAQAFASMLDAGLWDQVLRTSYQLRANLARARALATPVTPATASH